MSTDSKKETDLVVEMPDIYAEEFSVEESTEEKVEPAASEAAKAQGFDPYDTVRLYRK